MENSKEIPPILVGKPFLPPLKEFQRYLGDIWEKRWLTNNGEYHQKFEKELADFLGVPYVCLFSNGTLALVAALQCLRIVGEVITTPFSFVATTHSLWWNDIKPVFVDVDPVYGCLDVEKIESAITPHTTAILPVHVYGNPCNLERIQKIADTYGLSVIYDAAHAFNVRQRGGSILNFGDLSVLSFHATKIFNTFEGGAIVCHDEKIKRRIDFLKNFGFADETTVIGPGLNAKMNEFQSALGLLQLKYINEVVEKRKEIANRYRDRLYNVVGIRVLEDVKGVDHNYAYFPIFIGDDYLMSRDALYDKLKNNNIYARRYFYPLISNFPTYRKLPSAEKSNLSNANALSEQVLCLPIYPDLDLKVVDRIVSLIHEK